MSADNFTRPDLPPALRLSPIKKAVARALKTNKSIGQIASELGKSKNYIAKIAGNLYVRFGAQDRAHFAAMLVLPLNSPLLENAKPINQGRMSPAPVLPKPFAKLRKVALLDVSA
jgi:DNA-binding CsgD family transcriptional regulator